MDFFFEISDEFVLAVIAYLDHPFLFLFLPTDSFVFRGWILSEVYPVVAVLPGCCGSQVSFSIVQAVMINVVDEEMAGGCITSRCIFIEIRFLPTRMVRTA